MEWKKLFQPHILDRGFDYYQQGRVEDFKQENDFVAATVNGTHPYDVVIDVLAGEILDMNCECPYAEDGAYCKHIAAVLYCMDGGQTDRIDQEVHTKMAPKEENDVRKLVEEADVLQVRDFLIDLLKNDVKALGRFKSSVCRNFSTEDIKRYKKQINETIRENTDRYGFVDYRNAASLTYELMDFLDTDITKMLSYQQCKEAFELSSYLFVKIGTLELDDSDGDVGEIAQRCVEVWLEILEQCDLNLKRNMFQWCMKYLGGHAVDYMEDFILQILFESFTEEEFLALKLTFTEQKMDEFRKGKDSWTRNYNVGQWAIYHLDIMKMQKASQAEIDAYCRKNLGLSAVRNYYVADCMEGKKYDVAIRVLEDGKKAEKNAPGLVSNYSLQLKDLYKMTGDKQAYKNELWLLVVGYKNGDLALYKELKGLYDTKEWENKREIIFKKIGKNSSIDRLYEEERLYDRLLEIVLNTSGLHKLTGYEKVLKKMYPAELLAKYEIEVKALACPTTDRKRYREIAGILKKMKNYPGGAEKVSVIVTEWKIVYRNRRAMMEELKNV